MPFAALERPSLALGLLSSILSENRITNSVLYANLLFCDHVQVEDYVMIEKSSSVFGMADWVFASLVFPDNPKDDETYMDKLIHEFKRYDYIPPDTLRRRLYEVKEAVDVYMEKIIALVIGMVPRIVGCSSTFQQHLPSLALLKRIREKRPEIITMMGGANCETTMGIATHQNFDFVDFVVSGEADELIVPLVKALIRKGADFRRDELPHGVFGPAHRLEGYCCPSVDSEVTNSSVPRAKISSLANIPCPDYSAYFTTLETMPDLKGSIVSCLPVESSRGCYWGKCHFCGLNGVHSGQMTKDADRVISEIGELYNRYGIDRIEAVDNALHPSHVNTLLKQLVERGSRYRIFYEVRTHFRRNEVKLLSEAGVNWTQPGIESLHPEVLRLMRKGSQAWQHIQYLKWARQYGIRSVWKIMFDFPGENDKWYTQMAEMIPLLTHLEPPDAINQIRYDRYSTYFEQAGQYNLDLHPYPLIACHYDLPEEELMDLLSFFEDARRGRRDTDPVLSCLVGMDSRHGLRQVRQAVKQWQQLFWANEDDRPELMMAKKSVPLLIVDTRPIAVRNVHELNTLESEIILFCDAAKPMDQVRTVIADKTGASGMSIKQAVRKLLDQRLLIAVDNRILSLVLELPYRPLPKPTDYPAGYWVGARPTKA